MPTVEDILSQLLIARREALLNKDREAMGALLHHKYVYVNSIGSVLGKEQYLDYYCGEDSEVIVTQQEFSEIFVLQQGMTAFLILRSHETFEYQGKAYAQEYRVSHVLVQNDDGWVFSVGQSTPIV